MNISLSLTEPQEDFLFSEAKFPAFVAGLGSGKTHAGIMRLIVKLITERVPVAFYSPTYDLLRLRVLPGVEETLTQFGLSFTTNQSKWTIETPFGVIMLRSIDTPQRIISYEVAHSIIDELDTLPKDKAALVFRKVVERNRTPTSTANTVGVVSTPDQGCSGFLYERWGHHRPDHDTIIAPTSSNPFLPAGYIKQIETNYDPLLREIYLQGGFVSLSREKVYHSFQERNNTTDKTLSHDDRELLISVDFNVGGCVSTVGFMDDGVLNIVDEFVSQNTFDFVTRVKKHFGNKNITIFPDASGRQRSTNSSASDIAIIEHAGLMIDCGNTNPFIVDRVNTVNGMFANNKLKINKERCVKLVNALKNQGYDRKGQPEKFTEHPGIDDYVDSLGYMVWRIFGLSRGQIVTNLHHSL